MSAAAGPEVGKPVEPVGADIAATAAAAPATSAADGVQGDAVAAAAEAVIVANAATMAAATLDGEFAAAAASEEDKGSQADPGRFSSPRPAPVDTCGTPDARWDLRRPSYTAASPGVLSLKRLAAASSESSGSSTDCSSSLPSTEPSTTPSEFSTSNGHGDRKRLKITPRRSKKSKHLQLPHPLGVKPLGNAFLCPGQNGRSGTLGTLALLDDDLIVHILGLLAADDGDVTTLARVEATSRGLYAFVNSLNSLWRDRFLQRFEGKVKRWCGSWKRTYAWHHKLDRIAGQNGAQGHQLGGALDASGLVLLEPPNPPTRASHLFSDTLFHPFRLSLTPIDHFLAPEAPHIPIAHVDVSKPGAVTLFRERHAEANVPAIIEGAMSPKDWPCRQWTLEHLASRWPTRYFQCEAVRCRLPTYLSYAKSVEALCGQAQVDDDDDRDDGIADGADGKQRPSSKSRSPTGTPSTDGSGDRKQLHHAPALVRRTSGLSASGASSPHSGSNHGEEAEPSLDPYAIPDESPFYLFDAAFADDPHASLEWRVPKIFHQISAEVPDLSGHSAGVRSDLFSLLGPLRPDHRWIIAGPGRSGSGWHKDPNGTSAWNAVLTGRKAWMMLPPHVVPPGVYVSDDEAEVTAPLSIAEWLIGFAQETRRTYGPSAARAEDRVLLEGVCEAGEVLYVPSGWWHLVVNLEESVALTQNFVSPPELGVVLDFMKNKADQLSGFKKPRPGVHGPASSSPHSSPADSSSAAAGNGKNSNEVEDDEECENGAGFGVFELFCDRLGKFDKELLSSGLEKMAAIEARRAAEDRLAGRTCTRIVRAKAEAGDGDGPSSAAAASATGARAQTWWEKLKQEPIGSRATAAAAQQPADDVEMRAADDVATAAAAKQTGPDTAVTFSFGSQLAGDEELDEVPW
ncbi:uncharacterized protein PFL1_03456 [Pseudozyma flocculosa PF-1]|uniref:JmjC domain-containing protein n=2 Tax=Pseudozyma flocculosa TaxID=84751 RepID=A0A5C3FAU4_9BASI|nr:uncharacterized protein PFL1_03456 [Pseudozyma flocculosa PF-1]EPQ29169.1 hypothetical protein PFL1_03456 [Pseudozyma flocculosa PF-1]SPO41532.1 uncharacterized protein PSFLO_07014 [Pseudozyma flocculosa]